MWRATCRTAGIYSELSHHRMYRAQLVGGVVESNGSVAVAAGKIAPKVGEEIVLDWQQTVSAPMAAG